MIDLEKFKWQIGSMLSMAPHPWHYDRGKIECGNGNGISETDVVAFLNFVFDNAPKLVGELEAARNVVNSVRQLKHFGFRVDNDLYTYLAVYELTVSKEKS